MTSESLTVRSLAPDDYLCVANFLASQDPRYLRFFYGLGPDASSIRQVLTDAELDVYSGMYWRGELAAFFMLRGWDAGYEVPSFGVVVSNVHRGGAFMRLALDAAKLISRLSGAKRLMAKIHPENISPRGAARLGLRQTGVEESTGNIIYHIEL